MTRAAAADDRPRRDLIVEAARTAFRRDGIAETPLDEVASLAGVARCNLYRYFRSREELILEVLISEIREVNEARWERLTLKGPVRPIILDSLMLGHELAHDEEHAEVARTALSGEGLSITADLVTREPSILAAQYEYWGPVLEYGRARGEIVPHMSNERIVRWFLTSHVLLAERPQLVIPDGDALAWFRDIVVPPVVLPS
jgi:AcrR family transcriptional regulator